MADILHKIEVYKRREIAEAKVRMPLHALERAIEKQAPPRGFAHAIETKLDEGSFALIAEIKKASPSKGLIRADFDPPALAKAYEKGGAAALSVLTDGPSFQGAPEFLGAARDATRLPALRKDFLYDPYQVYEARAWGADCILIIMAAVDDETAHAAQQGRARPAHGRARGSPQRGRTGSARCRSKPGSWESTTATCTRSRPRSQSARSSRRKYPAGHLVVGESGISTHEDCVRLARAGVRAFLVGESLMRQKDVARATHDLLHGAPVAEQVTDRR